MGNIEKKGQCLPFFDAESNTLVDVGQVGLALHCGKFATMKEHETMGEKMITGWSEEAEEGQHLTLDQLLLEDPSKEGDTLSVSDAQYGAEERKSELSKRVDQLKSRAEMTAEETFRHMRVQKAISKHMQPTLLALFRIEVIIDAVASRREASLTRQAVEDVLVKLETELVNAEMQLDHLIRENISVADLKKNPVRFTNPLKISFTITCQQSRRMLNILTQLDRVLVKSTILDMFGVTDGVSTKSAGRKWLGGVINGMRSLVNMARNVMRAQYIKRAKDMDLVAEGMGFDKKSVDEAKAHAPGGKNKKGSNKGKDQKNSIAKETDTSGQNGSVKKTQDMAPISKPGKNMQTVSDSVPSS